MTAPTPPRKDDEMVFVAPTDEQHLSMQLLHYVEVLLVAQADGARVCSSRVQSHLPVYIAPVER